VALVHVFACVGRFTSEEDARRFVDVTYSVDGDAVLSRFLREVQVDEFEYEPGCIEVVYSGVSLPIRQLLRDASWAEQWVAQLDPARRADTAICVFPPNRIARPHASSLDYCGAFSYSAD
jgi:hypothetical protein